MITWQFWVLMMVIYSCADRIGNAIEGKSDEKKPG